MSKNFNYQQVADTVADNYAARQNAAAFGSFANNALAYYQQAMQQQRLDALSNQIMASQNQQSDQAYAVANASKATAVQADDPDLQGTAQYNADGGNVYQYEDGSSPGDPPTDAQMAAHNASLGYSYDTTPTLPAAPGDLPATGGYAALRLQQQIRDDQNKQFLQQARIKEYLAQAQRASTPRTGYGGAPIGDDGLTANQRLTHEERAAKAAAPAATPRSTDLNARMDQWFRRNTGVGVRDWGNFQNPRMGNAAGEGKDSGDFFFANVPSGQGGTKPVRMPRDTFNTAQGMYQQYLTQMKAGGATGTTNTATNTAPATSSIDETAVIWARANPGDPRATTILQRNGLQ